MATLSLSVDHVKAAREVLLRYYASHTVHVTAGWFLSYIAIQTFAVPGSVALSLLGGAIFGLPVGFPLVALTSTTGATIDIHGNYVRFVRFRECGFPTYFQKGLGRQN